MSSTVDNLHRSQAAERARLLHVDGYLVELDLTTGDSSFRSRTVVSFGCTEPGASTFVNLTASAVTEITLNGRRLDPGEVFDGNRLTLPALASDNELTVVADCPYMRTGEGLHRFVDPVDGSVYLYTQFETFDAHRMYACFDQPDLKATFTLTVTAPPAWTVVSNMDVPSGPEPADSGARVWRFAPSPRMSTYITALVAGPYVSVRDTYEGPNGVIPLGIYCRASLAEYLKPDELFEVTKQGFDFFHRVFDYPYPFGKYDQLFVPEFNAGAMENAGCVTFLEDYVFRSKVTAAAYERRAETVLHEMAHMWFGDLVTMRWWDDLWLNESFATYMAVLSQAEATKYRNAWTTFANAEKTWAYRQDQLPSTHPIAAEIEDIDAVEVNFDGITYAKGASVLRQLVAWVGQEEFFRGVRAYFRRHEYGNTTLSDLLGALEQTSGRVLGSWAAEWLETTGVNTLRARFDTDDADWFTSFAVEQTAVPEHPTLRSHRVAIGLYNRTTDGLVRTRRVETDVVGASTDVPELIGVARPDLVLINDDDLTYAKIRLDERSLATLTTSIGEFRESLPRALCWTAVWDMTRDAELAGRDYIRQVLSGIDRETDIGMVQTLLRQAKATADLYVDPAHRLTVVTALRDAARHAMFAAPGASDRQLAWTRAYAWFATDQDDASTLRGILDGSVVVDGLTVDAELRWSLLGRLAALGAADEGAIAAELARDNTAAGQRHAAAARAARPTAEAKEEAWASVVDSNDLPNAMQAAVLGGFVQVEQRDLLRPYIERYFDTIEKVWQSRTSEVAQTVVVSLYPTYFVEQATLDRTEAFLRDRQPPPALRRLLVEGSDAVRRALRAQQRDAQQDG